jgi:osmotically-inducible protein OsmY
MSKKAALFRIFPVMLGASLSIAALAEVADSIEDKQLMSESETTGSSAAARAQPFRNDEELTRQIRKDLVSDDALSASAKNVKIATRKGHVTLRGEVRSVEERTKVVSAAERSAGSGSVKDELKIKQ